MPQISQQDVAGLFKDFGIDPSQAELAAFTGLDSIDSEPLIADYALAKKSEMDRQKNDPLNSYITMADGFVKSYANQAQTIYGQMQDLLSSAPKLFGSMTPDQVTEYLAPLQNEFAKAQAVTETAFGNRGLTGSSTEAFALQEGATRLKENVLATGLDVGMKAQKSKADAMQAMISQLFGSSEKAMGAEGAAVGQKSAQDLGQSNLIASLPYFMQQSDQAAVANFKAQNSKGTGFLDSLSKVNQGINLIGNIGSLGMLDRFLPSKGGTAAPTFQSGGAYPQATPTGAAATGAPGVVAADPAAAALL